MIRKPIHLVLLFGLLLAKPALANVQMQAAPGFGDQVGSMLKDIRYTRLQDMLDAKLEQAQIPNLPWSDDYWALYAGTIAKRYADPRFPDSEDWKKNFEYAMVSRNSTSLDDLSPAEKYDLLVGDDRFTLTSRMWEEGRKFYQAMGEVYSWMGICEGWAAASLTIPRPSNAVTVLAADGRTWIRFYPSDIKALATLLWARAPGEAHQAGLRCETKDPARDANGRVYSPSCYDTNPATWHVAVVNQLGANQRGLVMDVTYDAEVWNQPVSAYRFSLFNPETGKPVKTLDEAKVSRWDFRTDKFRMFRSITAKWIVGVSMSVVYTVETEPTHSLTNSVADDMANTVEYNYDLELDDSGRIVGGEWYSQEHPDFIWAPAPDAHAQSKGDQELDRARDTAVWTGQEPLPLSWARAAKESSALSQPLERVVRALVTLSNSANQP